MINILDKNVVNKIAAGEVVERPASIVKELVENSLDAGATEIRIFIRDFGTTKIQITDNGKGIAKNDFEKLFHKHATSKIEIIDDLENIHSFGFRGEALASIASVSEITLSTKSVDDEIASEIFAIEGKIQDLKPSSLTSGTEIVIEKLFENIPARKKFLKAKATENKAIQDILNKFVIANPQVSFYIDIDGITRNYPASNLKTRIASILKVREEDLVEIYNDSQIKISGFVVHPRNFFKARTSQFVFVNGRPIIDNTIGKAAVDGYDTFLMKHQYPAYAIFLNMSPKDVDVNVHPRKTEVRFVNPSDVYKAVRFSVNKALMRTLKDETLGKLKVISEELTLRQAQGDNVMVSQSNHDSIINEDKKDYVRDFESFLNGGESEQSKERKELNESDIQTHSTEEAMIFSGEVIEDNQNTKSSVFLDFENATQLLNSYIITSNGTDILIIDQHAASERFFYEKYLKELKTKKVTSKVLLFPEVITLDEFEIGLLEKNLEIFEKFGFGLEIFGSDQIKISEVPEFVKLDNFQKVLHKILNDILENQEISNVSDNILHEIAAILACHTAVRFGDKLNRQEIREILINLSKCEDPYNCPHGRPVIQDFSKYDIEKKFKRCGI